MIDVESKDDSPQVIDVDDNDDSPQENNNRKKRRKASGSTAGGVTSASSADSGALRPDNSNGNSGIAGQTTGDGDWQATCPTLSGMLSGPQLPTGTLTVLAAKSSLKGVE